MTDELGDLIATLDSIRDQEFPHISEEVVEDIIHIEYETMEDRETTQDKISEIVESHLEEVE